MWARSNLDLPQLVPKLLAVYLLSAIGLKGGVELQKSGLDAQVLSALGTAVLVSLAVPVWTFFLLRRRLGVPNG